MINCLFQTRGSGEFGKVTILLVSDMSQTQAYLLEHKHDMN